MEVKKPKYERATAEQLYFYKTFVQNHPELHDRKNKSKNFNLWLEIAKNLNGMKGPTRTATKWKESLLQMKNQMHSRARKERASRMVTGGAAAPAAEVKSETIELGVDGGLLQVKLEDISMENYEVPSAAFSVSESVPADSFVADEPSSDYEEKPLGIDSKPLPAPESEGDSDGSFIRRKKKMRSNDMLQMVLKLFESREERGKQMLKEMERQTAMLQRVGDGMFAINKALEKFINK